MFLFYDYLKIKNKRKVIWIDGDKFRKKNSKDLGYSLKDRKINSKRIQVYCKKFDNKDYIGGNYGAAVNFDTTLPMIFTNVQNVDVRYFLDTANLWGVDYSSAVDQSNTIRASTGVVVDWFTPIGPLNFSLAQDISKADDDKTETFQFNLGTTF